jgi:hypothetical protein
MQMFTTVNVCLRAVVVLQLAVAALSATITIISTAVAVVAAAAAVTGATMQPALIIHHFWIKVVFAYVPINC